MESFENRLRELLLRLAGEVSLCWEPKPSGIFDSTAAMRAVDQTLEYLLADPTLVGLRPADETQKASE